MVYDCKKNHMTENTDGLLIEILVKVNPIDKYLIPL